MIKIRKVIISGFRGILVEQNLNLEGQSVAVFGPNSHGKSSFVDGLEWFLSSDDQISSLNREDAGVKSYPHIEAESNSTYVKVLFNDSSLGELKKLFQPSIPTKPLLSDIPKFSILYQKYTVPPYLRHSEIAKFVFARKAEKYKDLARWMGFEPLLNYQERIDITLYQSLIAKNDDLSRRLEIKEQEIREKIPEFVDEKDIIKFCNNILEKFKLDAIKSSLELNDRINKLKDKLIKDDSDKKVKLLIENKSLLSSSNLQKNLPTNLIHLKTSVNQFKEKGHSLNQLNLIELYEKALESLNELEEKGKTCCPLCDKEWNSKADLIEHISGKIRALSELKEEKNGLMKLVTGLESEIQLEKESILQIKQSYKIVKDLVEFNSTNIDEYEKILIETSEVLKKIFSDKISLTDLTSSQDLVITDYDKLIAEIDDAERKLSPGNTELTTDFEQLVLIKDLWNQWNESKNRKQHFEKELEKFVTIKDLLNEHIKTTIKKRFDEISNLVGTYFKILRPDKDIKDIKIELQSVRNRAQGRSAEISLNFYNTTVSPAYKILSESLHNSLGLAIFFACIKTFNSDCKFIILDDIINSLDTNHRLNVIKLLKNEFNSYQCIVFTHDQLWFDELIKVLPSWKKLKILNWIYDFGPRIEYAKITKTEVEDLIKDSTTIKLAGSKLGDHSEGVLNILCENTEARFMHRFYSKSPITLNELYTELVKNLKDKIRSGDPGFDLVEKISNMSSLQTFVRNYSDHTRITYPSTLSPEEMKAISDEWFELETSLFCNDCKTYISYNKVSKWEKITCVCGKLELVNRKV